MEDDRFAKLEALLRNAVKTRYALSEELTNAEYKNLRLRRALFKILHDQGDEMEDLPKVIHAISLFLSSANAILRSNLALMFDKKREYMMLDAKDITPDSEKDKV